MCLAVAACGGESGDDDGACVGALSWSGTTYYEMPLPGSAPPQASALGSATMAPCRDEDPAPAGGSGRESVRVVRLEGIAPEIAVAREGDPESAYLAEGFLPELREHPLHAATEIGEVQPTGCEERIDLTARVVGPRGALSRTQVRIGGGEPEGVSFAGDAAIRGFRRAGQAYLAPGDLLRMRGRYCRATGPGPDPRVLVVSRVRPAD